jgi:hypothetical protein
MRAIPANASEGKGGQLHVHRDVTGTQTTGHKIKMSIVVLRVDNGAPRFDARNASLVYAVQILRSFALGGCSGVASSCQSGSPHGEE